MSDSDRTPGPAWRDYALLIAAIVVVGLAAVLLTGGQTSMILSTMSGRI